MPQQFASLDETVRYALQNPNITVKYGAQDHNQARQVYSQIGGVSGVQPSTTPFPSSQSDQAVYTLPNGSKIILDTTGTTPVNQGLMA